MNNLILISVLSMAGLATFFASMLAFADKKLQVVEDPKITEVYKLLPHVNCGACGYVSCHDFAEHVVTDGEEISKCRVLGEEAKEELFKLMGQKEGDNYPLLPLVQCAAENKNKEPVAQYEGLPTCRGATLDFGGGMQCQYGCMGFGDCTEVCQFDALHMKDGLPRVDIEKCTGCGKCAKICPRGIIIMQEKRNEKMYYVACSSKDVALRVREVCGVGCIACGICEKLSPEKYFVVADNLSRADYSKQDKQEEGGKISAKCPTKVIKEI